MSALDKITPMFLANAAFCIENGSDVKPETRKSIIDTLIKASDELRAAARLAPTQGADHQRAYAIYRKRPDENGDNEFFHAAMWHNDTIPGEGERIVSGWFVPDSTQGADARIAELEAENEALRHDIERHIANHAADLNAIASDQEKFETWAKSEEYDLRPPLYDKDCAYVSPMTNAIWIGWQAARAPTQGADARPVAIYQVRFKGQFKWLDVERAGYDLRHGEEYERRIVYATRDAAPSDARLVGWTEEQLENLRDGEVILRKSGYLDAADTLDALLMIASVPKEKT